MREISEVQEIQAIALDILEYIDRICWVQSDIKAIFLGMMM